MEVIEVESSYYDEAFANPYHIFNAGVFNSINSYKAEKVYYLLFKDSKIRMGIILGVRAGIAYSPFSAPFGGFQYLNSDIGIDQIDAGLKSLEEWSTSKLIREIKIVLPPLFYNRNFLVKLTNSLYRFGYTEINKDVNYQFLTDKLDEQYSSKIWYNARKNLKKSNNSNLEFRKLESSEGQIAYDIIAQNRSSRGFPLRMTWEQVKETTSVIPADFFVVLKDDQIIASAIVFHVASKIVQVIYWGDLPQFSECKTMNFLSFQIFKYYKENNIEIIDIGPSTENSIPNYGLCEFKESIGCDLSLKSTYLKINHNVHH
ncbi:hypothetical protein FLA105534_03004 [Flavobacterium bizetiae]|uniref:BioF2-like acetyltransferase domain-containing protein n=1 Tax=Flavobacterium bizetiae TaxID=2704140 RepID=A0A6J4GMD3_9FLAO|nr:hypothetical protein [Flavobacterium bizetiae]CAA9200252.1 hypothetical protein FLA105534_03004 [Flavobacterium bizetiae]CAD5344713.1 hypothetical protein FLA105535_04721 [Flavobacterium bizetiae]CAD5349855.1 hypothetical protein FLA105534_03842 [Flavobacterium bizetiae]